MTNRDLDRIAAELCRRQHGVFAGRQLLFVGADQSAIDRRVNAGTWIRLETGVFTLPAIAGTWKRQLKAAELGHPLSIVSGASAGVVHGMPGLRPGRPEITVPHGTHHRSAISRVRRRDDLATCSRDGFRVTDVAQTILDLAPTLGADQLRRVVEAELLRDRNGAEPLAERCISAGRRRIAGAGRLRSTLDELLGAGVVSETDLERQLRRAFERSGVGPVLYQASPPWWPDGLQRVDALLPVHLVIVEGDGRAWHTRVDDFERDRERDNLAAIHGYRVLRFTWRMLTVDLAATIAVVRALRPMAENAAVGPISLGMRG